MEIFISQEKKIAHKSPYFNVLTMEMVRPANVFSHCHYVKNPEMGTFVRQIFFWVHKHNILGTRYCALNKKKKNESCIGTHAYISVHMRSEVEKKSCKKKLKLSPNAIKSFHTTFGLSSTVCACVRVCVRASGFFCCVRRSSSNRLEL